MRRSGVPSPKGEGHRASFLASSRAMDNNNSSSDEATPTPTSQGLHNLLSGLTSQAHSPPSVSAESSSNIANTQPQQTLFNTPSRSIFLSGPPTSSLSANTAQASMTATSPSSSSRPLLALKSPLTSPERAIDRSNRRNNGASSASTRSRHASRVEKDIDDPSVPAPPDLSDRRASSTPTALTRLFGGATLAPAVVNQQNRVLSGQGYTSAPTETSPLPQHLYTRGFLNGRHSDIAIHAFNTTYNLHRLLLDRAPFFSSAFSGPWSESSAKEMKLRPDDIDPNITQAPFELALKRLYRSSVPEEEDKEAMGLLATGCWLEMSDLVESSVDSMLRQMTISNLSATIKFVTGSYYGLAGEKLLMSARAMLCRDGWKMPLDCWDGIPGDVIREVIGGDGFFVPDEWERWGVVRKVYNRRLNIVAAEMGAVEAKGKRKASSAFGDKSSGLGSPSSTKPKPRTSSVYSHPDIHQLTILLNEGIHYIHLSFEQLQHIKQSRDTFGRFHVPEMVTKNAIWMALELRQKVMAAKEDDVELGLKQKDDNADICEDESGRKEKTKSTIVDGEEPDGSDWFDVDDELHDSLYRWDGTSLPRKFWIPNADSTSILGDGSDAYVSPAPFGLRAQSHGKLHIRTSSPPKQHNDSGLPQYYTNYPPFRFSAEFPSPWLLRENKRVFSRTLWYAGSLWKIYIQKVRSSKGSNRGAGGMQLGIYLHRARERKGDEIFGGTGVIASHGLGSVDERTQIWENDARAAYRTAMERRLGRERGDDLEDESSGSGGDTNTTHLSDMNISPPSGSLPVPHNQAARVLRKASQTASVTLSSIPDSAYGTGTGTGATGLGNALDSGEDDLPNIPSFSNTLPLYTDGRPNIQTYFKIFSPSKGGRMLSVYESAPDGFNFSQSWGWKSSTLILDEDAVEQAEKAGQENGRLRFMVVLGNV